MLGRTVEDSSGADGPAGAVEGLGLLDVQTTMADTKTVRPVTGRCALDDVPVRGYEIHNGRVEGADLDRPMLRLAHGPDGARSPGGRITGVHVHGLFTGDRYRRSWLTRLGARPLRDLEFEHAVEAALDEVATALERSLDVDTLLAAALEPR